MTESPLFSDLSVAQKPLVFAAEPEKSDSDLGCWKVMLVDDDQSIHQATKLALKFFSFEGKTLDFISAFSAQEAKELIHNHPDTALILLDVIMETSDAGLRVAQHVREVANNRMVRIILRTGQPGQVPEESVVVGYDINDYKTKLELTQQKLFTTLVSSLRSFRDLMALQQSQESLAALNHELQNFNQNLERLVQQRTLALEKNNQQLAHEVQERVRAEEALRVYIHALTHDLRNPVTGMAVVINSLLTRPMIGEDQAPEIPVPVSVLERMNAGCDRQLNMIGTLIEAHRIDVWGVSLQHQRFPLSQIIEALEIEWEPRFAKKRMRVQYHMPAPSPLVNGDREQLWRVFENIFANVLKYNPPGIEVTVAVTSLGDDPPLIRCQICDNGIGIPAEQIANLFKLYQGSKPRPSSGLGIGLYICRQIVEAHGGEIGMNSQVGEGTECWFTLPAAAVEI